MPTGIRTIGVEYLNHRDPRQSMSILFEYMRLTFVDSVAFRPVMFYLNKRGWNRKGKATSSCNGCLRPL